MNTSRRRLIAASLASAVIATGCAAPQPADYADQQPILDLHRYFDGPLTAHGVFTDRGGRVLRRFTVALRGRWDGAHGTLEEDFRYSDGQTQRRVWHLTDLGGGRWEGRADDVVGVAQGVASGNALRWTYTLALPVDGTVWHVEFDDWMFLVDPEVMLNKAVMSKFGVRLGEVTLSFQRPPQ
ncbi:MAG: DUF3833 domain-containing protein [Rubrivivax sp.]